MQLFSVLAITISDPALPHAKADTSTLGTILQIVFITIGALAVLFLVLGGLRYIAAQGDPDKITRAKNAILYALIGLVIAASAEAIVKYALDNLS